VFCCLRRVSPRRRLCTQFSKFTSVGLGTKRLALFAHSVLVITLGQTSFAALVCLRGFYQVRPSAAATSLCSSLEPRFQPFSPGQAAASSHVKHARAGKEDAAPTATSIWASVALGRLQVCTRYGKEDAVPVVIEQENQRRSRHLVHWVRREALGLREGTGSNIAAARDWPSRTIFFINSPQSLQTRRHLRSKHQGDWQTPCKKRQAYTSRGQLHARQSAKHHSHAEWKSACSSAMDISDCNSDCDSDTATATGTATV